MSPEALGGFAAAAVGLLGIVVSLYVWWSHRRVRVCVDVREAWKTPTLDTLDSSFTDPTVFEATVVCINRGERPVHVEVLGLEVADGSGGWDDRLDRHLREVPSGGAVSMSVDEEMVGDDFDMRQGVRGYAELASRDGREYSDVVVPAPLVDGQ